MTQCVTDLGSHIKVSGLAAPQFCLLPRPRLWLARGCLLCAHVAWPLGAHPWCLFSSYKDSTSPTGLGHTLMVSF